MPADAGTPSAFICLGQIAAHPVSPGPFPPLSQIAARSASAAHDAERPAPRCNAANIPAEKHAASSAAQGPRNRLSTFLKAISAPFSSGANCSTRRQLRPPSARACRYRWQGMPVPSIALKLIASTTTSIRCRLASPTNSTDVSSAPVRSSARRRRMGMIGESLQRACRAGGWGT